MPRIIPVLLLLALLAPPPATAAEAFGFDQDLFPYYPSLIRWNTSPAEFTPPEVCGGCHPDQFRQWTGSVHALAFQDPVYQGELAKGVEAAGHDIARQCEGCHSPAGMVTGEIEGPGLEGLGPVAMAGVSCDICHSINAVTHTETPTRLPENGSFVLTPGLASLEGVQLVKRAPFSPSEGCGGGFHECEESPLHLRADLCASCHQVYHYSEHFPLEATWQEWMKGPYAQRGILCQDCHMVETETFLEAADDFRKPERTEYRHYFNGANYLLYHLARGAAEKAGDPDLAADLQKKFDMAVARLQAAAGLELSPVYRDGALAEVRVRVKNLRAGHNLPTSLTNVRQMWVELTVRDGAGQVLATSGTLDDKGALPENTRMLNSEGMGEDFHFAIDPWVVTAFSRHDTIPPRGYRDLYYGLPDLRGTVEATVEVRLRYRQADQAVAEALLAAVPEDIDLEATYGLTEVPQLPVVDMTTASASFTTRR